MDIDTLLEADDLYRMDFPEGWSFSWRLLTLKEYRVFSSLIAMGTIHHFVLYKKVFDKCYLGNPKLINQDMPMLIPISIGQLIMYLSGDCASETTKEDITVARDIYFGDDVYEVMKRAIITAYPTYSLKDLDSISRLELIRIFVMAEYMLIYKTGGQYKPIDVNNIGKQQSDLPQATPINFDLDNQELRANLSPWDLEEAGDMPPSKPRPLTMEQARQLDRARKQHR